MASSGSAAVAAIPRFLLPRRGPMWQSSSLPRLSRRVDGIRQASTSGRPGSKASRRTSSRVVPAPTPKLAPRQAPKQPAAAAKPAQQAQAAQTAETPATPKPSNILEKPAKFNPPSHGSRLPRQGAGVRSAQHYGGELSASERAAQKLRQYPGLMSPPGTWSHWFWNSRSIHMGIAVSTLTLLALWTFFENFRRTSPYVDMLPTQEEALAHPIQAVRTAIEVVRLTENQRSLEITERRQQRVDDVAKRTLYRKAHGMEETVGFASGGGWFASKKGPDAPQRNEIQDDQSPIRGAVPAGEVQSDAHAAAAAAAAAAIAETVDETGKRKKFLGLF